MATIIGPTLISSDPSDFREGEIPLTNRAIGRRQVKPKEEKKLPDRFFILPCSLHTCEELLNRLSTLKQDLKYIANSKPPRTKVFYTLKSILKEKKDAAPKKIVKTWTHLQKVYNKHIAYTLVLSNLSTNKVSSGLLKPRVPHPHFRPFLPLHPEMFSFLSRNHSFNLPGWLTNHSWIGSTPAALNEYLYTNCFVPLQIFKTDHTLLMQMNSSDCSSIHYSVSALYKYQIPLNLKPRNSFSTYYPNKTISQLTSCHYAPNNPDTFNISTLNSLLFTFMKIQTYEISNPCLSSAPSSNP
jgi:hypothetical protein